jgi:hypothetical protein
MWVGVVIREHVSPKRHAELVSASIVPRRPMFSADKWTLNQVQGDGRGGDGKKFTQRRGDRRAALPQTSCWSRRRAEHNSFQHPSCHIDRSFRLINGPWSRRRACTNKFRATVRLPSVLYEGQMHWPARKLVWLWIIYLTGQALPG